VRPSPQQSTNNGPTNFIKEAIISGAIPPSLAAKPINLMTPRERQMVKHQLESNFLRSFKDKLHRDDPSSVGRTTDSDILNFARELTKGAIQAVPKSYYSKEEKEKLRKKQQDEMFNSADQSYSPVFKKEIAEMTIDERNSIYTFTLYRIILKLISGKRLDRGRIVEGKNEDAPLLSASEQLAMRREAKRQFLESANVEDQAQIVSFFQRAEHAIHRFNAMQLGNHSLPPRTKSDIEKYKQLEEMGEPDSPVEKYWNKYYTQEGSIDEWYCDYNALKHLFDQVKTDNNDVPFNNALIMGCGMSSLGVELLTNNFSQRMTQIDISRFAIIHMQQVYKTILRQQKDLISSLTEDKKQSLNLLDFKHVDVREMGDDFEDNTFDVVVDKACLDNILTSETGEIDLPDMEMEVWRVLKPTTGQWLIVSVLPMEGIESLLIQCPWKVECVGKVPFAANRATANFYRLTKVAEETKEE